jgi:hypothetical protein
MDLDSSGTTLVQTQILTLPPKSFALHLPRNRGHRRRSSGHSSLLEDTRFTCSCGEGPGNSETHPYCNGPAEARSPRMVGRVDGVQQDSMLVFRSGQESARRTQDRRIHASQAVYERQCPSSKAWAPQGLGGAVVGGQWKEIKSIHITVLKKCLKKEQFNVELFSWDHASLRQAPNRGASRHISRAWQRRGARRSAYLP